MGSRFGRTCRVPTQLRYKEENGKILAAPRYIIGKQKKVPVLLRSTEFALIADTPADGTHQKSAQPCHPVVPFQVSSSELRSTSGTCNAQLAGYLNRPGTRWVVLRWRCVAPTVSQSDIGLQGDMAGCASYRWAPANQPASHGPRGSAAQRNSQAASGTNGSPQSWNAESGLILCTMGGGGQ